MGPKLVWLQASERESCPPTPLNGLGAREEDEMRWVLGEHKAHSDLSSGPGWGQVEVQVLMQLQAVAPWAATPNPMSEHEVHPAGGLSWWSGDSDFWGIRSWNSACTGKPRPSGEEDSQGYTDLEAALAGCRPLLLCNRQRHQFLSLLVLGWSKKIWGH